MEIGAVWPLLLLTGMVVVACDDGATWNDAPLPVPRSLSPFDQEEFDSLSPRLDAQIAASKRPADRPVLFGEPKEGNAGTMQTEVVASMKKLHRARAGSNELRLLLRENLESKKWKDRIDAHAAALDALRDTAQLTSSWNTITWNERRAHRIPNLRSHRAAYQLLLADAFMQGPERCVITAVTVLRLAQDAVIGLGIHGVANLPSLSSDAARAIRTCSRRASREMVAQARDAMLRLAEHSPSIGSAMETSYLMRMFTIRSFILVPKADTDIDHGFTMWAHLADAVDRVRVLETAGYPAPLAAGAAEYRGIARLNAAHSLARALETQLTQYLEWYGIALARLRALTLALDGAAALPNEERSALVSHPALVDPFSGEPFGTMVHKGCVVVWSKGPNGVDDTRLVDGKLRVGDDDTSARVCMSLAR